MNTSDLASWLSFDAYDFVAVHRVRRGVDVWCSSQRELATATLSRIPIIEAINEHTIVIMRIITLPEMILSDGVLRNSQFGDSHIARRH